MANSQVPSWQPVLENTADVRATFAEAGARYREAVSNLAAAALGAAGGVDAAFLSADAREVFVVAHDHGMIDRGRLLEAEERLEERIGPVVFSVRASQGRDPNSMFEGLQRII